MTRRIINTKQESLFKYYDYNGKQIQFHKENGYLFSDNKSMDDCVNHFLSQKDFILKQDNPKEIKIESSKEDKKENKEHHKENKKEIVKHKKEK